MAPWFYSIFLSSCIVFWSLYHMDSFPKFLFKRYFVHNSSEVTASKFSAMINVVFFWCNIVNIVKETSAVTSGCHRVQFLIAKSIYFCLPVLCLDFPIYPIPTYYKSDGRPTCCLQREQSSFCLFTIKKKGI